MDLSNPLATVTPTLDAAVLQALAATTGAATGAHVHRLAGQGSDDGVRRVLARLVRQGIVLADEHAHATLYRLNRDHVAAGPIIALTQSRNTIVDRTREALEVWESPPLHASLFGSFARGTADEESDIDVLVIRDVVGNEEAAALAGQVRLLTGNDVNIVDITPARVTEMMSSADPLIDSWRSDHVHLTGGRLLDLLRTLRIESGSALAGLK